MVAQHLTHLYFLDEQIALFTQQIAAMIEAQAADVSAPPRAGQDTSASGRPADWADAVELLGTDMARFGSAGQSASWAKVSLGNNESAGKRYAGRTGQGNGWLRSWLVQAAHSAVMVKDTYFAQVYRRLVQRREGKKAIMAVAHRLLLVVYHMLHKHEPYRRRTRARTTSGASTNWLTVCNSGSSA